MINFSLVMSVYAKENPLFLSRCVDSLLSQTAPPDEIIVVKDGPLTDELEAVLDEICSRNEIKLIALPENVTQGPARAEGIKAARYEWVAIMDSDDICRPDRFEKQLVMIENRPELGLIGGQIAEFFDDPKITAATRIVPESHADICEFMKKRNPFNSMTVMLKRDLAMGAGNYDYFPWFEDYDLWVRMIKNGAICANLGDVLVDARVGGGMYGRRRGGAYIRSEWRMQKRLKALGVINGAEFIRNAVFRIPVRLLPARPLSKIYRKYARGQNGAKL